VSEAMANWLGVSAAIAEGAIAALGFGILIWQIVQVRAALRTDAEGRLAEMGTQLRSLVVNHPGLRDYLFEGEPAPDDLSPEDRHRLETLAEILLHYLDNLQKLNENLRTRDRSIWASFMEDALRRSPTAVHIATTREHWYTPELVEAASRIVAERNARR